MQRARRNKRYGRITTVRALFRRNDIERSIIYETALTLVHTPGQTPR